MAHDYDELKYRETRRNERNFEDVKEAVGSARRPTNLIQEQTSGRLHAAVGYVIVTILVVIVKGDLAERNEWDEPGDRERETGQQFDQTRRRVWTSRALDERDSGQQHPSLIAGGGGRLV
ncbi:hypothetical protein FQN53_003119 [Emmonsiellopsis sp. PD_33]|nr:hypothetical protein FQN53_003119 [Emmonsiellopsis sp. PD_33]